MASNEKPDITDSVSGKVKTPQLEHSAHAANLFVKPDQFAWVKGEELVGRYEPADAKYFATCFCTHCGSSLPWLSRSDNVVIIPAGTLDENAESKRECRIQIRHYTAAKYLLCLGCELVCSGE